MSGNKHRESLAMRTMKADGGDCEAQVYVAEVRELFREAAPDLATEHRRAESVAVIQHPLARMMRDGNMRA